MPRKNTKKRRFGTNITNQNRRNNDDDEEEEQEQQEQRQVRQRPDNNEQVTSTTATTLSAPANPIPNHTIGIYANPIANPPTDTYTNSTNDTNSILFHKTTSGTTTTTTTSTTTTTTTTTNIETDQTIITYADPRRYMYRPIVDIDATSPDLCTGYEDLNYQRHLENEIKYAPNPDYMGDQIFIDKSDRARVVNQITQIHERIGTRLEMLFSAIPIMDRYLSVTIVEKYELFLIGITAYFIACKYEDACSHPLLEEVVAEIGNTYTAQQIREMEINIFQTLGLPTGTPTIYTFLCRALKAAHADRTMVQMSCYLAERSLVEYSTLQYRPSLIAAKIVHSVRMTLRRHPWSPTLVHYTRYDEPNLVECGDDMREYLANSQDTVAKIKYSNPLFGGVARMPIVV